MEALAKAFLTFYVGCHMIGMPDIPLRVIAQIRQVAIRETHTSWGVSLGVQPRRLPQL
jgi:hypothetical protein